MFDWIWWFCVGMSNPFRLLFDKFKIDVCNDSSSQMVMLLCVFFKCLMRVNKSTTHLIQQAANNALKFHLDDRTSRTFWEVQAKRSNLLPTWCKLENPLVSLGKGRSKSRAKPNNDVSNWDVVCEGKEGRAQGFCATICFTFTKLDELWHANGQKWARMKCFFSPKPVGFGSQLCRIDTKISHENPKSMSNCVGLGNQLFIHHNHGTKPTGELPPPWHFIQKASSWRCQHLLCKATCFHCLWPKCEERRTN